MMYEYNILEIVDQIFVQETNSEKSKNLSADILFLLDALLPAVINKDKLDYPAIFIDNVNDMVSIYDVPQCETLATKIFPSIFKLFEQVTAIKLWTDIITIVEKIINIMPEETL